MRITAGEEGTRMALTVRPGLALRLDPENHRQGWLSGAALPSPILVRVVRRNINGDALVTDNKQFYSVKSTCIVCGEKEAGRKRLEIMKNIYAKASTGDFAGARQIFFEMYRLLL